MSSAALNCFDVCLFILTRTTTDQEPILPADHLDRSKIEPWLRRYLVWEKIYSIRMEEAKVKVKAGCCALLFCATLSAQWLNQHTPGIPRTKDGKPDLSAPAPRTADGKPDLSGVWGEPATRAELLRGLPDGVNLLGEDSTSRYFINILADFKPPEVPILPSALAVFRERAATAGKDFSLTRCLPSGLPVAEFAPEPRKIIQMPGLIVVLYEADMSFRQIYMDGRKLPVDPQPTWLGYSVARWEDDTLVVDVNGFNDKSWLDAAGHPHSGEMHLTERFRRIDFGHMKVEITVDDPRNYTKPFTVKSNQILRADTDLLEFVCLENEKDANHYSGH